MKSVSDKDIARLHRMAVRALDAKLRFSDALDRAKQRPGWEAACDTAGIFPQAQVGDWMC